MVHAPLIPSRSSVLRYAHQQFAERRVCEVWSSASSPKTLPSTQAPVPGPLNTPATKCPCSNITAILLLPSDSPLAPVSPCSFCQPRRQLRSPCSSPTSLRLASSRTSSRPLSAKKHPFPLVRAPSTTSSTNMVSTGAAMGAPAAGTPQRQTLEKKPVKFSNLLRMWIYRDCRH